LTIIGGRSAVGDGSGVETTLVTHATDTANVVKLARAIKRRYVPRIRLYDE